jgi:hypothetical protein
MIKRIKALAQKLSAKKLPGDLANVRDEMVTVLHTCLYLFSLK